MTFHPILVFCLSVTLHVGYSQDVSRALDALNSVVGDSYQVENKGRVLVIKGFREGKQLKTDKVNIFDLDMSTMTYSVEGGIVAVRCHDDLDGCVERILLLNRKKSYRQRMLFDVPEGGSGQIIVKRLREVLTTMSEKY